MSVPTPALTAEIMKQREEYRIKCVKGLNDAGFCLFPLVPGMKDPAVSGWQELDPGVYHERNLFGNYGVTLRAGDLIIDVDPRNGGEASFEKLVKDLSLPECDTFRVRTGGGAISRRSRTATSPSPGATPFFRRSRRKLILLVS